MQVGRTGAHKPTGRQTYTAVVDTGDSDDDDDGSNDNDNNNNNNHNNESVVRLGVL